MVVEQATGLPASGFDAVGRDEVPREQERVWAFDWYAIFPPTLEELAENKTGHYINEQVNHTGKKWNG